jgi:hypothetical protein
METKKVGTEPTFSYQNKRELISLQYLEPAYQHGKKSEQMDHTPRG